MNASENPNLQWIKQSDHGLDMVTRVKAWIDAGTPLVWRPIFDRENFPQFTPDMLDAGRQQSDFCWFIPEAESLLSLPDGIKGWLMPFDATDTDVVCGRWANELHFMGAMDSRNGSPVTYQVDVEDPVNGGSKSLNSSQIVATP